MVRELVVDLDVVRELVVDLDEEVQAVALPL